MRARSVWIGLEAGRKNGGGNNRVGLSELRLFGELAIPLVPARITGPTKTAKVYQSSDYSAAVSGPSMRSTATPGLLRTRPASRTITGWLIWARFTPLIKWNWSIAKTVAPPVSEAWWPASTMERPTPWRPPWAR